MLRQLVFVGLAWACLPGCGSNGPKLYPVEGKVRIGEKPLHGYTMTFTPLGQTPGSGSIAYMDADGRFKLMDVRGSDGAYAGEYRVSFYPAPTAGKPGDPTDVIGGPPVARASLPAIFIDPTNSPIRVTIPETASTVELTLTPGSTEAKVTVNGS